MTSIQHIRSLLDMIARQRRHRSTCEVEPQLAMADSRLSALNLNWFFVHLLLFVRKQLWTHIQINESLGCENLLTNTQRKVIILILDFPLAKQPVQVSVPDEQWCLGKEK